MSITDDPADPNLTKGVDSSPVPQADKYLVLSEEERAAGFVRRYRDSYKHTKPALGPCDAVTTMKSPIAETYARKPDFYGATYCTGCGMHRPVSEFTWTDDGEVVGS